MFDFEKLFDKLQKTETCIVLRDEVIKGLEYQFYPQSIVWQVETEITFKNSCLALIFYINFPNYFPYSFPKIFIKREIYETIKYIPHINSDFSICIFDDGINEKISENDFDGIIEYMIHKAKEIIKRSEDEQYNKLEFNSEFKAYWELKYGKHDAVSNIGLHLVHKFADEEIKGIKLRREMSNYEYVLYNEGSHWENFKIYLEHRKFLYDEINVIVLDNPFCLPPYNLTFKQSVEIVKLDELKFGNFKSSLKKNDRDKTIIIFPNLINGKIEIYGWSYRNLIVPLTKSNGGLGRIDNLKIITSSRFENSNVLRITFDNLTPERLQLRTSGIIESHKSIAISGIGSVGSNLIHFLKNLPINKFHLIDDELLKLENINRHLSGFNYINYSKVDALKDQIINSNPIIQVEVKKDSIQTIISKTPDFLNECDFHIISVGKTTIENFILNSVVENKLIKPMFLFWVEPFLASGQMIFINPKDAEKAKILINDYPFNVLADNSNYLDKLYLKEGSCQSGYFPYSSTYLIQFLSAIFPYLKMHILEENLNSTIYTWIGDKEFIKAKDLEMTDFAKEKKSYELIISYL